MPRMDGTGPVSGIGRRAESERCVNSQNGGNQRPQRPQRPNNPQGCPSPEGKGQGQANKLDVNG